MDSCAAKSRDVWMPLTLTCSLHVLCLQATKAGEQLLVEWVAKGVALGSALDEMLNGSSVAVSFAEFAAHDVDTLKDGLDGMKGALAQGANAGLTFMTQFIAALLAHKTTPAKPPAPSKKPTPKRKRAAPAAAPDGAGAGTDTTTDTTARQLRLFLAAGPGKLAVDVLQALRACAQSEVRPLLHHPILPSFAVFARVCLSCLGCWKVVLTS